MRVGIVASPFVPVPPVAYGGIELFVATLALYLTKAGVDVIVYTNGESSIDVEKRFLYPKTEWPVENRMYQGLKELHHTGWSVKDASDCCDVIHLNGPAGASMSLFANLPVMLTIHHPHSEIFNNHYRLNSSISYITLSEDQQRREAPLLSTVIPHGIDLESYTLGRGTGGYLCWLGRLAPVKGAHLAIECARRLGVPLKLAGNVQPMHREYFEQVLEPQIDGTFIEYVGEVDLQGKNELFRNAMATLFPITWDEPFGLVMVESMACGTPVLALNRGSVEEVVADGISGFVCGSVEEMAQRYERVIQLDRTAVRRYAEARFSAQRMARDHISLYQSHLELPECRVGRRRYGN